MATMTRDRIKSGDDACKFVDQRASDSGCHVAWRQNGSHRVGKVVEEDTGRHRGSLVVPMHGEVRRGTLSSILRMMARIGLLVAALVTGYAWVVG